MQIKISWQKQVTFTVWYNPDILMPPVGILAVWWQVSVILPPSGWTCSAQYNCSARFPSPLSSETVPGKGGETKSNVVDNKQSCWPAVQWWTSATTWVRIAKFGPERLWASQYVADFVFQSRGTVNSWSLWSRHRGGPVVHYYCKVVLLYQ